MSSEWSEIKIDGIRIYRLHHMIEYNKVTVKDAVLRILKTEVFPQYTVK